MTSWALAIDEVFTKVKATFNHANHEILALAEILISTRLRSVETHPGPFSCELQRDGGADASRAAGDDGDFA